MSSDWCKGIEDRMTRIEDAIIKIEGQNDQLIKIVVIGLLAIVGAVVGVKIV